MSVNVLKMACFKCTTFYLGGDHPGRRKRCEREKGRKQRKGVWSAIPVGVLGGVYGHIP